MLNENANKWVAALRSGEYEQCQGSLSRNGRYCCLGIACAISPASTAVDDWSGRGALTEEVRVWLGLQTAYGDFNSGALSQLNDAFGKTFDEIADIIESEPEGLFVNGGAQ